jgi:oligopeptide transport system substrate-binding protein
MWPRNRYGAVALGLAGALVLSACGGDGGGGGGAPAGPSGAITVRGCNPENPFIPTNTNETCGGNVLDAVLAKLVRYNPDTAAPELDIAQSIETTDNVTYTIKLKQGIKFHDGTEVKAKNFVDAWNWGAYGPNAQLNAYFFEPIEGYAEIHPPDPDGESGPQKAPTPKTKTMTGLKMVDDYTFTAKMSTPNPTFRQRLGYTAFAPLPDSFFTDNGKAFGEKPIGAGPFKFVRWDKNRQMVLEADPAYNRAAKPKVQGVTYKIYQDPQAAYNDVVANAIDITEEIPTSALTDQKFKTDLAGRFVERATGTIQTVTFAPTRVDPAYANPKLRQAISMAINRPEVVQIAFAGTREPADGWVSPVVDGFKPGACGELCKYDPTRAKQLFQEAGGFSGTMTISYNADGAHKEWSEATCNSIKNTLGVECQARPVVDFATFRGLINDRKMKGMFRTGWQMDYPSIENFLVPLYATGASSNDGEYSNPKFDALLKEAASATGEAVNAKYQEAERMLAADMPAIPLWHYKEFFGYSNKVENVKITAFGTYDLSSVTLKGQ